MQAPPGFSLFDPAVHADPYPAYARLRAEAPVWRLPGARVWLVSRHAECDQVLRDARGFASDLGQRVPLMSMVMQDPPVHTRLRQTMNKSFTPRAVDQLAARVAEAAAELAPRATGRCEFVQAFANPLPVTIICEMLGVPLAQRDAMNAAGRDALLAGFGAMGLGSPELLAEARRGCALLMGLIDEAIVRHRQTPADNIVSSLIVEEQAGKVDAEELRHLCALLLIAGHETTSNLIANGMHLLATDEPLQARLRAEPYRIAGFVEELVRLRPPLQRLMRRARRACSLAGAEIAEGDFLMVLPGSANRDPARWPELPDHCQLDRDDRTHLGFGAGIHACPGAPLARLEARIAFATLLARSRHIALDAERRSQPIVGYGAGSLGWNELHLCIA